MAVFKDLKCDECGYEFEVHINPNAEYPKCPKCESSTHWLPKLNDKGFQISYTLRVMCDGFNDKTHFSAE
jgi:predicted Zn-ribbon and HTH transcriptional regulator